MKRTNKYQSGKLFLAILSFLCTSLGMAQVPQVPSQLKFADLTIKINEQARREIQSDVDALYRNPTYFRAKAERVNMYLPIVERELVAAGVPADFKYLVIQESSLIADAVSTSNAVGFWQFKQGTAEEVYLRVDGVVDERKNIVASTQGAARYLKKNNAQFDNWMCAMVAYQMGLGGARGYFGNQHNGKKVIEVDRNFHWYFKKFLAHKVAFEAPTVRLASNSGYLDEVSVQGPTTLRALAPRLGVTETHLKEMNKWALKGQIPDDRPYSIVYLREGTPTVRPVIAQAQSSVSIPVVRTVSQSDFPKISGNVQNATQPNQIKVNELEGVLAPRNSDQREFAENVGLKPGRFRRINDLDRREEVEAGQYYYTEPKRSKGVAEIHVVMPGETLWGISQMYGIKLSALKSKNRISNNDRIQAGMILTLTTQRKKGEEIPMVPASELRRLMAEKNLYTSNSVASGSVPINQTTLEKSTQNSTGAKNLVHMVEAGENLFRIAQRYGVSVDQIKSWNKLPNDQIKVGQRLTIIKP